jgi:hypothetical protein
MTQAINGGFMAPVYEGDFKMFVSQLDCYCVVAKIEAKKELLLSLLSRDLFILAADVTALKKLTDAEISYDAIVAKLTQHLQPEKSSLVARYEFDSMVKTAAESVREFVARLHHRATECKFSDGERDERLRDRFIAGINDPKILGTLLLLSEDSLTFSKAVEKASTVEKTRADAQKITAPMDGSGEDVLAAGRMYHLSVQSGGNHRFGQSGGNHRFGQDGGNHRFGQDGGNHRFRQDGGNHRSGQDGGNQRFKNVTCFKCFEQGHIARFCRQSGNGEGEVQMSVQRASPIKKN